MKAKDALLALALINGEPFDFLGEFISCRNAGLEDLLSADHQDAEERMEQLGIHLHNSIHLFDTLFFHGIASPLVNLKFVPLNELLGAKAELWPRFLPLEIDSMCRTGFVVNFQAADHGELRAKAKYLLTEACKVRNALNSNSK